jgi:sulfite reductase (NADPH) flavoprotein alpha-component
MPDDRITTAARTPGNAASQAETLREATENRLPDGARSLPPIIDLGPAGCDESRLGKLRRPAADSGEIDRHAVTTGTAIQGLSPLPDGKAQLLDQLIDGVDSDILLWLSGYLAGLARRAPGTGGAAPAPEPASAAATRTATVLFGSQTGHAERLATDLAAGMKVNGLQARLCSTNDYPRRELKDERLLLVIISTQGDGDPPDNARELLDFLNSRRAPRFEALRYAVLALGDSSYPKFCHVGRQMDARLAELGAQRVLPLAEADVDFETVATPWAEQILAKSQTLLARPASGPATLAPTHAALPLPANAITRSHPFAAELLVNQPITGRSSQRDVRHLELLIDGSGLSYQPGDSLGIWPVQAEPLVDEILNRLRLDGNEEVEFRGETMPLRRWLRDRRELTALTRPFLAAHVERCQAEPLREALDPEHRDQLSQLLTTWQLADLLERHPAEWAAGDLVAALRPLAPRLYSISSSPLPSDGKELDLTVALVDYRIDGAHRWGVCSRFLADLAEGAQARVFLEPNARFRLPVDGSRDIVMIGPGTGVAPFRAFVQHRAATGASGRNWLFFGNRHFRSEFLYQVEWQEALAKNQLHRLDLAFSRDSAKRVYVPQRMQEQAAELYAWIEGGAHLYVCGDASRMAPDVEAALIRIGMQQGHLSESAAADWLRRLMREGRYVRDVY